MKSSCQLMAKECMLSTGKLPLGGLSRNSVVRINDLPDMTSAVYHGSLRPLFLFQRQLMVKKGTLSTGKMPLGGLRRNTVV